MFTIDFPEGNIFGVQAGPSMAASDGFWIMLKPLPPGEHTINFGGSFGPEFTIDITYHISVVPQGHYRKGAASAVTPSESSPSRRDTPIDNDVLGSEYGLVL